MPVKQTLEDNGLLILTFSRPEALNALNVDTLHALERAVDKIYKDASIRGAILTGDGEKSFIAGADIREIAKLDKEQAQELSKYGQGLFRRIEDCPKPMLAAINGFALGGGCELAMACHIRIAVESAKLGLPEVGLGVIPGYGGTQRLTRLVGPGRALELILTGEMIDATEARRIGLVNHIVPDHAALMELSGKIMEKILCKGPVAVAKAIESVYAGYAGKDDGYRAEARNFAHCATTKDFGEGTSAFLEKRKPNFKGE
ncbi:MAG TPA: enoyl-CoA hydratase-related protein [Cyclobacteriaceae bacterium]|nr:enoyl-CoA hydratase-related protein [Cyclobacteriaceae bacterium]